MNLLKKLAAALLAAAVMATAAVPAAFAETPYQNTDSDAVPEFSLTSGTKFEMTAGTKVVVPVELYQKRGGTYSSIEFSVTGGNKEVYVVDPEHVSSTGVCSTSFIVCATQTASTAEHTFTVTARVFRYAECVATQTFTFTMKVTSNLKLKGLNIESYSVSNKAIKAGDKFSISVDLKNESGIDIKNAELFLDGIDTKKFVLDTGFSKQYIDIPNGKTGTVVFNLIAQKGITLERENLTLTLTYTLDENKTDMSRTTSTQVILNCVPEPEEATYGKHDLTMTKYTVSSSLVEKGTKFDLTVEVKNNGKEEIKSARVSVTPDGTKFAIESGLAYTDFNIRPGETKRFVFKLIGGAGITFERENVPIVLEFGANSTTMQAAVICKPEKTAEKNGKYDITVTDYSIDAGAVAENTTFNLTLNVKNSSKNKIEGARLSLLNLDGTKFALNSGLTYRDFDIAAGETQTYKFSLIGCKGIASVREVIQIELNYGDITNTSYATVTCLPKEKEEDKKKVFAPTIIIESYDFGGEYVAAGSTFPLDLVIKNASSEAVIENLKVTINGVATRQDGAIAFSPANSSNSFFFESVMPHEEKPIDMFILARSDATPNSYPIEIAFTYEYTVNDERYQASAVSETITIPLRQEDRLEFNDPEVPNYAVAVGTPATVSVSIVNKGKSDSYNVSAEVSGEGFTIETPKYYIGNIKSGVEEIYDAKLTPVESGQMSGQILFTYEDSNGTAKTRTIDFSFEAMEESFNMGMDMGAFEDMGPAEEPFNWVPVIICAVVLIVVIIIIVVIVKKRKKAKAEEDDEDL